MIRTSLLLLGLSSAVAAAQSRDDELAKSPPVPSTQSHTTGHVVRIGIDNDLIAVHAGKPDDHDYTHGTHVILSSAGAPQWVRRMAGNAPACLSAEARRLGCVATTVEIAQEIYTPRIDGTQPVPGERPYTGWLFASPALHHITENRVRSFRVLVGVTGPASLGEQAQDGVHALLGENERRGWRNQLRSELGLALAYDDRHLLEQALGGDAAGALALGWGAIAGNIRTSLHFDANLRVGLRGDRPWSPEDLEVRTPMGLYAIGGFRQELVMHDMLVDGNTFHESVRAERIPFVREVVLGIGVRRESYAVEYRWVQRSREYEAQPRPHAWGSIGFVLYRQ